MTDQRPPLMNTDDNMFRPYTPGVQGAEAAGAIPQHYGFVHRYA